MTQGRSVTGILLVASFVASLGVSTPRPAVAGAAATALVAPGERQVALTGGRAQALLVPGDGSRIIISVAGELRLLDGNGAVLNSHSFYGGVNQLARSADGRIVYALSRFSSLVLAFDSTTLAERARFELPEDVCAASMAIAGDRLWFGPAHCIYSTTKLGSLDLALAGPYVPTSLEYSVFPDSMLASSDPHSETLFIRSSRPYPGPRVIERLHVSGTTATREVTREIGRGPYDSSVPLGDRFDGATLAVAPDGSRLVTGSVVLDARTLEILTPYDLHIGTPVITPDSTRVVGTRYSFDDDERLGVWSLERPTIVAGGARDWSHGFQIAAVDRAGTAAYFADEYELIRVPLADPPPLLAVDADAVDAGTNITGQLSFADRRSALAAPLTIERVDGSGATLVGLALADASGRFSVLDPAGSTATHTYRIRWPGDLAHPDGALALVLRAHGAPLAEDTAASGLPDARVPLTAGFAPRSIVVDDVHGRVFLVQGDQYEAQVGLSNRAEVFDLEGTAQPPLVLAAPVADLVLTPDRTHVLAMLPTLGRVDVLDAQTLLPVGSIIRGPLSTQPITADFIGTDLWIQGRGDSPSAGPTSAVRDATSELTGPYDAGWIGADPGELGFFFATGASMTRWDGRQRPPVAVGGTSDGFWNRSLLLPPDGGDIHWIAGDTIRTLDRDTFEVVEVRSTERIHAAQVGPAADLLLTASQDPWMYEDGFVSAWDESRDPYRRYVFPATGVGPLAATPSGSHAYVVLETENVSLPPPRYLQVLHEPFARCRVLLDPVVDTVVGLTPLAVSGRVEDLDGLPIAGPVTLALGEVVSEVVAGADGRFVGTLVPDRLGVTTFRAVAAGCRAAESVSLLAPTLPAPSPPVPFATTNGFVDRQARDLLGAPLGSSGQWIVDALDARTVTPDAVIAWFASLTDTTRGDIARLYLAALGREPTRSELAIEETRLANGASRLDLANRLGATSVFRSRFGQSTNTKFVSALYSTLLGRAPTAAERSARLAELTKGATRAKLVLGMAQTATYRSRVALFVEAELVYLGMLRRSTTPTEMWTWVFARVSGTPAATLVETVRTGAEYGRRIVAVG